MSWLNNQLKLTWFVIFRTVISLNCEIWWKPMNHEYIGYQLTIIPLFHHSGQKIEHCQYSQKVFFLKKYLFINSFLKLLICVLLFATPCTVAYQASLSMGVFRQECWSGLPFPSPGDLSNPGLLHCRRTLYPLSHQGSPFIN